MKALQPAFWPLAGYLALTFSLTLALLVLARHDLGVIKDVWSLVALPLGMPWTAVALAIHDFAPGFDRALIAIVALSVPANAGLLYLVGRHLDRRWSSRLQN